MSDINNEGKTEKEIELEKQLADANTDIDKKKEALEAITGELINTRKDNITLKEQLGKPNVADPTQIEIAAKKVVDERFSEQDKRKADLNRKLAWVDFTKNFPIFNPENDINGLRKAILDEKLKSLITNDHIEREEILSDFQAAYRLIDTREQGQKVFPSASTPDSGGSPKIVEVDSVKFSEADLTFIQGMGLDPKRIAERIKARGK